MFKKVIGQDVGESARPSAPTQAESQRDEHLAHAAAQARPQQPVASARPSSGATRNVLSNDVEIKGTVKFSNDLVVDGRIEGEISSDGNLTIGENARIKAEIKTGTIVVYGKVHGNLTAVDRVDLKATAEVVGDIKARVLSIEAGAVFVGKSTVGAPAQVSPQATAKPVATEAPKQGNLPRVASS